MPIENRSKTEMATGTPPKRAG
ncbi:hypothetical protein STRTUCAR8_07676, partial [Streptomyces turgidiscabies Car8]